MESHTTEERKSIQRAVAFATKAHAGQFRKKSGLPYITHPMAVLSQISEWNVANVVIWRAALCHDILEDCPSVNADKLMRIIGSESTDIVSELTFVPDLDSDEPKHMQKRRYMESFRTKSVPALVVKVADRICNTFDFLCTDSEYAPKYWGKADALFDALMARTEEVVDYFEDESIPAHIKYSRTTLGRMVR